ncbi:RING-H2 finger protein ATL40-like [Typha angustifolia]|uniref:RING-H2 finger protein ATL40-like n=1 Tax=Typha angustifolia TaxID=59011 RepID=UPI003C2BDA5B
MTYRSPGDQNYGCCGVSTMLGAIATSLAFLFVLVVLYFYVRYLLLQRRRRRQLTNVAYELGGIAGLDPEVIATLPSFAFKKTILNNSSGEEETLAECSVCLSAVEDEEIVRLLPNCKHLFHQECIDLWLNTNATCPVCRTNAEPKAEADEAPASTDCTPPPELYACGAVMASTAMQMPTNVEKEVSSSSSPSPSVWLGRMVQRDNRVEDLERQ